MRQAGNRKPEGVNTALNIHSQGAACSRAESGLQLKAAIGAWKEGEKEKRRKKPPLHLDLGSRTTSCLQNAVFRRRRFDAKRHMAMELSQYGQLAWDSRQQLPQATAGPQEGWHGSRCSSESCSPSFPIIELLHRVQFNCRSTFTLLCVQTSRPRADGCNRPWWGSGSEEGS